MCAGGVPLEVLEAGIEMAARALQPHLDALEAAAAQACAPPRFLSVALSLPGSARPRLCVRQSSGCNDDVYACMCCQEELLVNTCSAPLMCPS